MQTIPFKAEFEPRHGEAVDLGNDIIRITAPNSGPFTFHGTNTYIVGKKEVAVIDPGPEDGSDHFKSLIKAIEGKTVSHILVTSSSFNNRD